MWLFKKAIKRNRKFRIAAHKAMLDYFDKEYHEDTPVTKVYLASVELFKAAKEDEVTNKLLNDNSKMVEFGLRKELYDAIADKDIHVE